MSLMIMATLPGAQPKLAAPVACLPPGLLVPRPVVPVTDAGLQRAMDLRLRYSLALQQQQQQQQQHMLLPHPLLHPHDPRNAMDPRMCMDPRMSMDPRMAYLLHKDPRARFFHEEPKPSYSYIGLISMALLSSKDKKLILGDIYQWILDNYPYFRARGPGWRNSIRHNLSLNDCFIKSGRAANGKGHYWAIHPANMEDFKRGDFRRRRAQRKVRRAMGLDVPDEEDSPSPPPGTTSPLDWRARMLQDPAHRPRYPTLPPAACSPPTSPPTSPTKASKRGFDVASLLAPDTEPDLDDSGLAETSADADEEDEWIDVDSTDDKPSTTPKRKLDTDNEISSPPPHKRQACDDTLDLSMKSTKIEETQSDNLLTSVPSSVPNIPPFWRPGGFPFPPTPFFPWGASLSLPSLPQSFTAALYANALSRTLPEVAASQNGVCGGVPYNINPASLDTERQSTPRDNPGRENPGRDNPGTDNPGTDNPPRAEMEQEDEKLDHESV